MTRHLRCLATAGVALAILWSGVTGRVTAAGPSPASIEWYTRIGPARVAALDANRPMLLEFWAAWCAPCKVMDQQVYADARVAEAMKRVIPLRVDMDAQALLARQYEVATIPTLVFADSHGNELFRHAGILDVDRMVQLLHELPGDVSQINQLSARIAANAKDAAALEAMGAALHEARLYGASTRYYDRALRAAGSGRRPDKAPILAAIGQNHLRILAFDEAAAVFERYLRDFAGGVAEPDAMLGLGEARLAQGRDDEARRVLTTLVARHPASPAAATAGALIARHWPRQPLPASGPPIGR